MRIHFPPFRPRRNFSKKLVHRCVQLVKKKKKKKKFLWNLNASELEMFEFSKTLERIWENNIGSTRYRLARCLRKNLTRFLTAGSFNSLCEHRTVQGGGTCGLRFEEENRVFSRKKKIRNFYRYVYEKRTGDHEELFFFFCHYWEVYNNNNPPFK